MSEIKVTHCQNHEVKIYVGRRVGYTHLYADLETAYGILRGYCDKVGLCVSVVPNKYIYTNGEEDGFVVTLINYPRFPSKRAEINEHAYKLAEKLMIGLQQFRVTVVEQNGLTYMLENFNADNEKTRSS